MFVMQIIYFFFMPGVFFPLHSRVLCPWFNLRNLDEIVSLFNIHRGKITIPSIDEPIFMLQSVRVNIYIDQTFLKPV